MARNGIEKLKLKDLKRTTAGLIADGGNLYLRVFVGKDDTVGRGWIFRYQLPGQKVRDMGLGSLDRIGLAKARELAREHREFVGTGIDPIERRNEQRVQVAAKVAVPTFDDLAAKYIATHRSGWRNPVHAKQWETTLATYASPAIGKLPVNVINTDHVLKVLEPIWHEKTDTAKRVRGRIETVLNYATVRKLRHGDNPARWTGYLSELLARPSKIAPVEHHPALPYAEIGTFMQQLRQRDGIGALALEFTILTCARTAETLGATWDEIDLDEKVWTVPANRIKAGIEHKAALSKAALAVLQNVRAITKKLGGAVAKSKLIFLNDRDGRQLSPNALLAILKRMNRAGVTVHGFRSAFRDWAGEETNFSSDICEMALAHKVGDKVQQAYRRKTGFQKRRLLAEAWASHCAKPVPAGRGTVLPSAKGI